MTFGLSDEIYGAYKAFTSDKSYEDAANEIREGLARFKETDPVKAYGFEILGSLLTGGAGAAAGAGGHPARGRALARPGDARRRGRPPPRRDVLRARRRPRLARRRRGRQERGRGRGGAAARVAAGGAGARRRLPPRCRLGGRRLRRLGRLFWVMPNGANSDSHAWHSPCTAGADGQSCSCPQSFRTSARSNPGCVR